MFLSAAIYMLVANIVMCWWSWSRGDRTPDQVRERVLGTSVITVILAAIIEIISMILSWR